MSENPYAPPELPSNPVTPGNESERIRRTHLNTEASIKSIGTLYIFGGVLFIFGVISRLRSPEVFEDSAERIGFYVGMFLVPILLIWLGLKLRRLSSVATIFAGILSALGLLAFPVGTIINLILLFTLFSPKGRYVVKPHYRQVIAETRHIRYRTSMITWILLAILVITIILGAIMYVSHV